MASVVELIASVVEVIASVVVAPAPSVVVVSPPDGLQAATTIASTANRAMRYRLFFNPFLLIGTSPAVT
jgi:hypothetical protein